MAKSPRGSHADRRPPDTGDRPPAAAAATLRKTPTGIRGFDDITGGGLPTGRPTLVCGGAGSGKTLFAMSVLVHGAVDFGEPGVFMSFEENTDELAQNVASLGFDLPKLVAEGKLALDYVHVERSEIEETGEYDLEGLFVRLAYAIESIGAKRVVLDTVEALFGGLANEAVLRAELRRLFRWLKDRGITAVVTGERGEGALTRRGLEEYVSDAVILLDHRVEDQVSTRRLRVVKYRGTTHGTNEYPFMIDAEGFSVLPITSLGLEHVPFAERVRTGIPSLDAMLGNEGYFRGSSILVSGGAGSGKTSVAASFVDGACRRGERALYFLSEESPGQVLRNMRSIGIDLEPWVRAGLLEFHAARPSLFGLEMHLVAMHRAVERAAPAVVVVDPITNLLSVGTRMDVHAMLTRLIDHLKTQGITAMFTSLASGGPENTDIVVSSLMDAWLLILNVAGGNDRYRTVSILKSRGMAHSNQVRELRLTDQGVEIAGPGQSRPWAHLPESPRR